MMHSFGEALLVHSHFSIMNDTFYFKASDRVLKQLIWWRLKKKGIPSRYISIIEDR